MGLPGQFSVTINSNAATNIREAAHCVLCRTAPQAYCTASGCFDEAVGLLSEQGASVDLDDLRENGTALPATVRFCGELRQQQSLGVKQQ